jgi:hypothetical protein
MEVLQLSRKNLCDVFLLRWQAYLGWLLANLGGLIIAYGAALTSCYLFRDSSLYWPGPEELLITAVMSLTIAGVSYWNLRNFAGSNLSAPLVLFWVFMLLPVYGILVAIGAREPVISDTTLWITVIIILFLCVIWASITWLHEQGLRREFKMEDSRPPGISKQLSSKAEDLSKVMPVEAANQEIS